MLRCKWLSLFMVIMACGKPLPELQNFNAQAWKQDRNGCGRNRSNMKISITEERTKLLALSETQIIELLGRPDQNELYKRNQKFYTYFIDPAPDCATAVAESPKKLIVRFNAMGLAKEVSIE